MKTFGNVIKLNVFIVWVLVVLLAGIATTIYANEEPTREENAKKDETEIKLPLEPGEKEVDYCKKLTGPKDINITKWELKKNSSLPNGLQLSETGYLFGTPAKQDTFTFEVIPFVEKSKRVIDKESNKEIYYKISLKIKPKTSFFPSENLRIITGYEISRASSTTGSEKAFLDVYFSRPLPFFFNKKRRLSVWGNIRFTSIPQQNTKTIGTLNADYFSTLSDLKLNEMTQSAEFLVGIERNLWSIKKSKEEEYNYTLCLTVAYGGSTPMVSDTNPQLVVFRIPTSDQQLQELKKRFNNYKFDGKEFISFVPEDRESFYHQLYFGFRLKTYTNKNGNSKLPGTFDISYGINHAASGGIGKLFSKKSVIRFDGFLPIEIFDIPIYLFGTAFINVTKDDTVHNPLILGEPVIGNDKPSVNSDKLLIVTEKANKRDFYKIGIGIDLFKLFKSGQDKKDEEVTKANKAKETFEGQLTKEKSKNSELEEAIQKTLNEINVEEKGRKLSEEDAKWSLLEEIKKTLKNVQAKTKDAEEKAEKNQEEEKDNQ